MTEIANLALALAICAVSLGLGTLALAPLDRLRACDGATRVTSALLLGYLIVHFAVWGVGSLRYDAPTMGGLLAALAVGGSFGLSRVDYHELRQWCAGITHWIRGEIWAAVALAVLVGLILTTILGGLAPPSDFDGLNYHLALAKFDLERGFIRPWDHHVFGYFPALAEMIDRLALALTGPKAAQVVNGLTAAATAGLLAALARSAGAGRGTAVAAAILYLSIRGVAWESGTTYVELMLGAYSLGAFAVLETWRRAPSLGLAALFGLLIAGAINTKYHGFAAALAFAPSLLWELRRAIDLRQIVGAAVVALAAILPFTVRNVVVAGDPVYPLFEMTEYIGTIGTGKNFASLLRAPWDISMYGARYFDGHVLGTPYLLALLPWVFAAREGRSLALRALAPAGVYFVLWFFLLSQQVRFLLPVMPFLCLAAAIGGAAAWRTVKTHILARACFLVLLAILAIGQAAYVGATALVRAPIILGLMDETTYFTRIPTIQGSHFVPCRYLTEQLKPGETYIMFLSLRSYYCPQSSLTSIDTSTDARHIATEMSEKRVRFLIVEIGNEQRNYPDGRTFRHQIDPARMVGPMLDRALKRIEPVFRDDFAAIYDTKDIVRALD
jgi:hypothetical protein